MADLEFTLRMGICMTKSPEKPPGTLRHHQIPMLSRPGQVRQVPLRHRPVQARPEKMPEGWPWPTWALWLIPNRDAVNDLGRTCSQDIINKRRRWARPYVASLALVMVRRAAKPLASLVEHFIWSLCGWRTSNCNPPGWRTRLTEYLASRLVESKQFVLKHGAIRRKSQQCEILL